jgi:ubiquinol-cytochrome c reductase cytochrome b subunit
MLDDLLSGTGLRIAYSIVLSVPFVGDWLASLLFGGNFPGDRIIPRLFIAHVLLIPLLIIGLVSVHLAIVWRQKHTQFRGRGRTEHNVTGTRLWPGYAARSVGLFLLVGGVLTALGGLVQVNPVWLYGPYTPAAVSTAAQPDWYMGWLEGALRLAGPWRFTIAGHTISEVLWPAVVLPGVTFLLLYLWPFIEARVTHDLEAHHLLDRPRDRPVRTAIGCGVLTFYVVLFVAGSTDIIAQKLQQPIDTVVWSLRILVIALPILVALFAWRMARDLRAGSRREPHPSGGVSVAEALSPAVDRPSDAAVVVGRAAGGLSLLAAAIAGLRDALGRRRGRRR